MIHIHSIVFCIARVFERYD